MNEEPTTTVEKLDGPAQTREWLTAWEAMESRGEESAAWSFRSELKQAVSDIHPAVDNDPRMNEYAGSQDPGVLLMRKLFVSHMVRLRVGQVPEAVAPGMTDVDVKAMCRWVRKKVHELRTKLREAECLGDDAECLDQALADRRRLSHDDFPEIFNTKNIELLARDLAFDPRKRLTEGEACPNPSGSGFITVPTPEGRADTVITELLTLESRGLVQGYYNRHTSHHGVVPCVGLLSPAERTMYDIGPLGPFVVYILVLDVDLDGRPTYGPQFRYPVTSDHEPGDCSFWPDRSLLLRVLPDTVAWGDLPHYGDRLAGDGTSTSTYYHPHATSSTRYSIYSHATGKRPMEPTISAVSRAGHFCLGPEYSTTVYSLLAGGYLNLAMDAINQLLDGYNHKSTYQYLVEWHPWRRIYNAIVSEDLRPGNTRQVVAGSKADVLAEAVRRNLIRISDDGKSAELLPHVPGTWWLSRRLESLEDLDIFDLEPDEEELDTTSPGVQAQLSVREGSDMAFFQPYYGMLVLDFVELADGSDIDPKKLPQIIFDPDQCSILETEREETPEPDEDEDDDEDEDEDEEDYPYEEEYLDEDDEEYPYEDEDEDE